MPDSVTLCECFARDGLQHEDMYVPTTTKLAALENFVKAGFTRIEATSYSHPSRVPAFADASEVLAGAPRGQGVAYKATCPNPKAVERACADLEAGHGADELSLLVSATEAHSERNLRASRETQWANIEAMTRLADGRFRLVGVISVALGCPFEGRVDPGRVVADFGRFVDLGVDLVTVGDTTGLGTPRATRALFSRLATEFPQVPAVAHMHDTRGTGLTNALTALEAGCRYFDSALGGVGGHPSQITYGSGMTGNVATEDLVNLFESTGVDTGLNLDDVMAASQLCEEILGRRLHSAVARSGWGLVDKVGAVYG